MIRGLFLLSLAAAAGCVVGTEGSPRVLLTVEALDGGQCPLGGDLVSSGVDVNDDGVLQATEVTSAVPLCGTSRIESGVVTANYTTPNWKLAEGSGERTFTTRVVFASAFEVAPTVIVSLRDVDCSSPQRVGLLADAVDQTGFNLTVRTWDVSLVNGVAVSWIAHAR